MSEEEKKEAEGGKEVEVPLSDTFTSRLADGCLLSYNHLSGLFVLDFQRADLKARGKAVEGRLMELHYEGTLKIDVRIFLTPLVAKRLLKALEENIKRYEEKFGEIKV